MTSSTPSLTPPETEADTKSLKRSPLAPRRRGFFHHLRRRVRKIVQVTHRWAALILGLVLLVIVVTGTILVFKSEIQRTIYPSAYKSTGPVTQEAMFAAPDQAADQVKGFKPYDTWDHHGVVTVTGTINEKDREVNIDPGTGDVLAVRNPTGGFFGFVDNLHECALSCEGYPGYIPLMNRKADILGNEELTVGGLLLGIIGIVLLLLSLGGLYLWWPGVKRFSRGVKIRRKSAYSINYDLHKVVGMIAIPFLLMWAITGAGFELKQVEQAWFAVLPGEHPPEPEPFTSKAPKGVKESKVSPQQALAAAQKEVPDGRFVSHNVPDEADKTTAYVFWFQQGFDPWRHGNYPGDVGVDVDRFDSSRTNINFGQPGEAKSYELWEMSFPIHTGEIVNPWWRSIWFVFSLVPILLAFTGCYTWLSRKRRGRAKKKRAKYRAAGA